MLNILKTVLHQVPLITMMVNWLYTCLDLVRILGRVGRIHVTHGLFIVLIGAAIMVSQPLANADLHCEYLLPGSLTQIKLVYFQCLVLECVSPLPPCF